jgi:hypothetical protein
VALTKRHTPAESRNRTTQYAGGIWRYGIYLISIGILFALTLAETVAPAAESPGAEWYAKMFSWDYWYQANVTPDFRSPKARYVTIVTIGEDEPKEVQTDICKQRVFLAKLLRAISEARPAVIAIDKFFMPESCADSTSTEELQHAMLDVSQKLPIVFGEWAYYEEELRTTSLPKYVQVKNRGFKDTQVIMKATLPLDDLNPGRIIPGLLTSDFDRRRIPLLWPAYRSVQGVGKEQPVLTETLAEATIRAIRPDDPIVKETSSVKQEKDYKTHNPFTSFVREEQFPILSAMTLVCDVPLKTSDWKNCNPSRESGKLQGQVVVIGQIGPGLDLHATVVGTLPGVVIQANYIESLLDRRVFRQVSTVFQLVIALLWFILIERLSHRWESQPGRAISYPLAATVVFLVIIHEVVILQCGYYMSVLFPGIVTVVGVNLGQQVERILAKDR